MPQSNDYEKTLSDLQSRELAIRKLVASEGWREITSICDGAVTSRRQSTFSTMTGVRGIEDCFTLARQGGEIGGIQFVLTLPYVMLKDIEQDIQRTIAARKEHENE